MKNTDAQVPRSWLEERSLYSFHNGKYMLNTLL